MDLGFAIVGACLEEWLLRNRYLQNHFNLFLVLP